MNDIDAINHILRAIGESNLTWLEIVSCWTSHGVVCYDCKRNGGCRIARMNSKTAIGTALPWGSEEALLRIAAYRKDNK